MELMNGIGEWNFGDVYGEIKCTNNCWSLDEETSEKGNLCYRY